MATRRRIEPGFLALLALVFLATAPAAEGAQPILELRSGVTELSGEYSGPADLIVVPPFDPAIVAIDLNGSRVATLAGSPYRVEIDLGSHPVQQTIAITASQPVGKSVTWSTTINRGFEPLSIRLRRNRDGSVEAKVTQPANDPVVEVAFFHGAYPLGVRTSPPWKVGGPPIHNGLLHAVAKTRGGSEATHGLTPTAEVHLENYIWQRVPIEVAVVDGSGKPLTNLKESDFRIQDDGEATRIVSFKPAFNEPMAVSILLDGSGSMAPYIKAVAKAASNFVQSVVREGDQVSLYSIHGVPRRQVPLTTDSAKILEAFSSLEAQGETALWDAIHFALRELRSAGRRRAIVLLSDGEDTDSITGWAEIVREVEHAGVPLYIIAFGPDGQGGKHADRLRYLAGQTGGFVVDASTADLRQAYHRIEMDIRARYAIEYEVFGPVSSSRWRTVKVSLQSPRWTARAIRGYVSK
jgi:Ca-activated chloride channel homolog